MKKFIGVLIYLGVILGIAIKSGGIESVIDIPNLIGVLLLSIILNFLGMIGNEDKTKNFEKVGSNFIYSGWIIFLIGSLSAVISGESEFLIPGIAVSSISLLYGYVFGSVIQNLN